MGADGVDRNDDATLDRIAAHLVQARLSARALPDFPGAVPTTLSRAYAIQDRAIAIWPDEIAGWKVGLIAPTLRDMLGAERLAGPVFSRQIRIGGERSTAFPVIDGGCAVVEGEFVLRLGADAGERRDWSAAAAMALADQMFVAVETCGSPLASIDALGPTAIASDFGNNAGLILGPAVDGWRDLTDADLVCESFIEGRSVGAGSAASLPNGVGGALAFLLNHLASRGRSGRAGDLISTGAITGGHNLVAGQTARISFGAFGDILCHAEMARPEPVLGGINDGRGYRSPG